MNAPEEGRGNPYIRHSGQYAHIQVVESALGRGLPGGAVVHHFDGNRKNNSNGNLVVCPSQKYHKLLHIRTRAFDECGNASFRKCRYCKVYCDPESLFSYENKDGTDIHYHRDCHRAANKAAYQNRNKAKEIN